ncbi:WD40-repeat-containing domain protein [Pilobolus umbonatus]|nr:WD40-repeat-containing domain protein [Pilobolus umbonatus]
MRLRRIVKENHGSDINQLSFFFNNKNFTGPVGIDLNKTFDKRGAVQRESTDTSNVLATVGGCELSVYDNEHCGDHLDIMSNFDLTTTEDSSDNQFETFCWLYKEGDGLLAVGGKDTKIHILSLANSQEIKVLEGHTKTIHDIQSHPKNDHIILSTSRDGTIRLWDIDKGECLAVFEVDATVSCFHPSGTKFISGNARGECRMWNIPVMNNRMDDEAIVIEKRHSKLLKKMNGDSYIEYWDLESEKVR